MEKIQPQFQRDFISLLPREVKREMERGRERERERKVVNRWKGALTRLY